MRALQPVVLFVLSLVAACSSGGNRPPDNGAGGTAPSFAGPWSIQSELIEASAPCPPLGLESVVAEFAFLLADGEAELYAVTAPGITTRSIEADTSSIHALTGSTIVGVIGVYYFPASDLTVELSFSFDARQRDEARVEPNRFLTLIDFSAYDGDAMTVVTDSEGTTSWAVSEDAQEICRGRLRLTANRQ